MEETEHRFDSLISNLAMCLDIMLKTDNEIKRIAHIDPFVPLGYPDLVQLWEPEGLAFPANAPIVFAPAFMHLRYLLAVAPHLQSTASLFQLNDSSHLFSDPFPDAYEALVELDAEPLLKDLPDKARKQLSSTDPHASHSSLILRCSLTYLI